MDRQLRRNVVLILTVFLALSSCVSVDTGRQQRLRSITITFENGDVSVREFHYTNGRLHKIQWDQDMSGYPLSSDLITVGYDQQGRVSVWDYSGLISDPETSEPVQSGYVLEYDRDGDDIAITITSNSGRETLSSPRSSRFIFILYERPFPDGIMVPAAIENRTALTEQGIFDDDGRVIVYEHRPFGIALAEPTATSGSGVIEIENADGDPVGSLSWYLRGRRTNVEVADLSGRVLYTVVLTYERGATNLAYTFGSVE